MKTSLEDPRWEDLDNFLEPINSLVEEEADWLARFLTNIEKGRTIGVVAEVDGKLV